MLILASASPRRCQLLESACLEFVVRRADIDEKREQNEEPTEYVKRLAYSKARAVAAKAAPCDVILGADTTVALGKEVLGKPKTSAEASAMLTLLSGKTHMVHTGWAIIKGANSLVSLVSTEVSFRRLSPAEIQKYVASGEPFDKAGGYGIQGQGGTLIDRVSGSYSNVIGLPLAEVLAGLRQMGAI